MEYYPLRERLSKIKLVGTVLIIESSFFFQHNDWRTVDSISTTWRAKAFLGTNRHDNQITIIEEEKKRKTDNLSIESK